jgi:hypothetical protein
MGCAKTVRQFGAIVRHGSFQPHAAKNKRVNSSYSWVAMSRKAESVIQMLQPYLVTKAREATVALKFMALPDGRTGGNGGCRPVDPALLLCKLKPRWRFRKHKPSLQPEAIRYRR